MLDYYWIPNSMQVFIKKTDALTSLSTDHLPITFSCFKNKEGNREREAFGNLITASLKMNNMFIR